MANPFSISQHFISTGEFKFDYSTNSNEIDDRHAKMNEKKLKSKQEATIKTANFVFKEYKELMEVDSKPFLSAEKKSITNESKEESIDSVPFIFSDKQIKELDSTTFEKMIENPNIEDFPIFYKINESAILDNLDSLLLENEPRGTFFFRECREDKTKICLVVLGGDKDEDIIKFDLSLVKNEDTGFCCSYPPLNENWCQAPFEKKFQVFDLFNFCLRSQKERLTLQIENFNIPLIPLRKPLYLIHPVISIKGSKLRFTVKVEENLKIGDRIKMPLKIYNQNKDNPRFGLNNSEDEYIIQHF